MRREHVIHPSYACDDGNKMKTKQRASGKIEIIRIAPYRSAATNSLFALRVNTYYQEVNCEEVTMRLTQQFNVVMICAAFAFIGGMLFI
ncbi:hypothetical protein RHIZ404_220657 [Rhizobium sp. EC-SD404]|nr:hypothetical protein RHIZ404_220657 [Rhizobium sp. EC-SD404]